MTSAGTARTPLKFAADRRRKPRSLALELVESIGDRVRAGALRPGEKLPPEKAIMEEFGVSRTVVREAISKLQAAGLVETRHGIGTFVLALGADPGFRIGAEQVGTLQDVVDVLELRIGVETEAAALAALRRTEENLATMRQALDAFRAGLEHGRDAVDADFAFHLEIARATQNAHFAGLMSTLGAAIIPRSRLAPPGIQAPEMRDYLRRINSEHESIYEAIAHQDPDGARAAMRTHLANSRARRRRAASLVA